jgi:hypothetical protein
VKLEAKLLQLLSFPFALIKRSQIFKIRKNAQKWIFLINTGENADKWTPVRWNTWHNWSCSCSAFLLSYAMATNDLCKEKCSQMNISHVKHVTKMPQLLCFSFVIILYNVHKLFINYNNPGKTRSLVVPAVQLFCRPDTTLTNSISHKRSQALQYLLLTKGNEDFWTK